MDIALIVKNNRFTIGITNGDLTKENGLDTAINLSLFTDARAPEGIIPEEKNNRGSLADTVSKVANRKHGSLLWTLDQSRLTPENRNRSTTYAQQALNWLAEDGLVKSVLVSANIIPKTGIKLTIIITANSGEVSTRYRNLWEMTGNAA